MRAHTAEFFLQVKADLYHSYMRGESVSQLRPQRITRKRPKSVQPGVVVVAVKLDLPDMLFIPQIEISAETVT